jgi:hypothetical protein
MKVDILGVKVEFSQEELTQKIAESVAVNAWYNGRIVYDFARDQAGQWDLIRMKHEVYDETAANEFIAYCVEGESEECTFEFLAR